MNNENCFADVRRIKSRAESLKKKCHTRMLVEQQDHKISLIAEQYTDIAEKLDKANDRAAQIDDVWTGCARWKPS
ncbi:MAG: hypothetical protein ACLSBB_16090 [Ruthenibacterium lactatiformans]